ncbi:YrhK family protein [Salinicoccus bachuensis]|uniref:YrhK family protein n=1 Tax=Salinicoccus bachuensis TaxID=3136731 RepID=A0ABZ3CL39_9STAP
MPKIRDEKDVYELDVGRFEIFFRKRYRLLSIINDLSLGLWFTVGSIMFFWSATQTFGTLLFLLGSLQLLGRPILKLIHAFFVKRDSRRTAGYSDEEYDLNRPYGNTGD